MSVITSLLRLVITLNVLLTISCYKNPNVWFQRSLNSRTLKIKELGHATLNSTSSSEVVQSISSEEYKKRARYNRRNNVEDEGMHQQQCAHQ